ncbi:ABC transporter permease [Candidatus Margulisiibacteriota bacterium]
MIFKIALRNIFRNLRRSLVSLLLSILCVAVLMFFQAMNDGGHQKMIDDNVEVYVGYIQAQGKGYEENPNYDNLIFNVDEVKEKIKDVKGVKAYTVRMETFTLFSVGEESVGGMLTGIVPSTEAEISRIKKGLVKGRYLKDSDTNGVYIGKQLAQRLGVDIGDEVVFLSSAVDYSMAAARLKVVGMFATNLFDFDKQNAFINKKYMDVQYLSDNIASDIVVLPENKLKTVQLQNKLQKVLDKQKYEVVTYQQTLFGLIQFINLDNAFGALTFGLLALIVFFVIMIFSLISVFQRTKEIGIMRAIGTSQKQIYKILISEGLILGTVSVLIGGAIGIWLCNYFYVHPINFASNNPDVLAMYQQFGMTDLTMPALLTKYSFALGVIPVFLLNILAILYPAWVVNKMKPIDAIEER